LGCQDDPAQGRLRQGRRLSVIGIWSDLLLFSCVAAFVTGIVLAAASLVVN